MILIKGECIEEMNKLIKSGVTVDLIICDLPYGCTKNKWDIVIPFDKLWSCYNRILKPNGVICLFGQGVFFSKVVLSNESMFKYDYSWDKVLKSGHLNAKIMPMRQHESIAVFYNGKPTYNPQMTIGAPLHSKGTSFKNKEVVNNNYNHHNGGDDSRAGSKLKYPSSILSFQKPHPSKSVHPTEKPINILQYLVNTYSNDGDLVLDNCMGSGSTGKACVLENRKFIGIELDDEIYNTAIGRLDGITGNK